MESPLVRCQEKAVWVLNRPDGGATLCRDVLELASHAGFEVVGVVAVKEPTTTSRCLHQMAAGEKIGPSPAEYGPRHRSGVPLALSPLR